MVNFNFLMHRCPVVLLRVEFGVLSRGKMGPTEVVAEYLRHGRANEVRMNTVTQNECTKLATCTLL